MLIDKLNELEQIFKEYQCRSCAKVQTVEDMRYAKIKGIPDCTTYQCDCGCRCFITLK
jgi:hypothetical protein